MVVRDLLGRETVIVQPFFTNGQLLATGLSDWRVEAGAMRRDFGTRNSNYGPGFANGNLRYGISDGFTLEGTAAATDHLRYLAAGATVALPFNILGRVGRAEPDLSQFSAEAVREYVRCYGNAQAIHASCEDYRAAGSIDLDHDRADRAAARKLQMPVLALWGRDGVIASLFACLADWREVASNVTGRALPCGHFIPEEAPQEALAEIDAFVRAHPLEQA